MSMFFGNATFVGCVIGDEATLNAVSFNTGMGLHSVLTLANTTVTSSATTVIAGGGLHGVITLTDTNITSNGTTWGARFLGDVGFVNLIRCVVRARTTSVQGVTAVYFQNVVAAVRVDNCSVEAFTDTGRNSGAVALYINGVASAGCVYVTSSALFAHCDAETFADVFGVLAHAVNGAVMFDGTSMRSISYTQSWGCFVDGLGSHSTLLLRSVTILATSYSRKRTLAQRAFYADYISNDATIVFVATTLRAPQGACLFLRSGSLLPGVFYIRGVYLAECYQNFVDTSAASAVRFRQNCLRLPGPVSTDRPIDGRASTIVYPCVNNTPRTAPVHVGIPAELSLQTCNKIGSIAPCSTSNTHETDLHGHHVNQVFDIVALVGSSSLVLQNCTVRVLLINGTEGSHLLATASTIQSVLSATQLVGNATFVGCDIGDERSVEAMMFPLGAGPTSVLTIVNTTITAEQNCFHIADSHGRVNIVDSRVTARGGSPTYGLLFNSVVSGPVTIIRSVVNTVSSSTTGTDPVFFRILQAGVHLVDCTLTALANSGQQGNAAGIQIIYINSNGCLSVTGGSISVSCSPTTQAGAYGGLFRSIIGGAVTFDQNVRITTSCVVSNAVVVQHISGASAVLLRSVEMTTLLHAARPNRNARALFMTFGGSVGDTVAVLDNVTIRAPRGVCLYFQTLSRSGLVDLRGVNLADCHHNLIDSRPATAMTLQQNCLQVAGRNTEAPLGSATTVFPCVNGTPRTTPIDAKATTIQSCTAFGSIAPFRILKSVTLKGDVNRSFEYLGVLVIEDPGTVVLSNIDATSITFARSVKQQKNDDTAAGPRITLSRCRIGSDGMNFVSTFTSLNLVIDGSAITASDLSSAVPLLSVSAILRSSIVVRDSTFTGRRMFAARSTIDNSSVLFQGSQFLSPSQGSGVQRSVTHFAFAGPVERSAITFRGCSLQSRALADISVKAPRVAISFLSLDHTKVVIADMQANLMETPAARFLDVGSYRGSCITIVQSSVMLSCSSQDTNAPNTCPQSDDRSFVLYGGKTPVSEKTQSSFITLDRVNISMATYSATAVFMPYLRNVDVVMSRVSAVLTSTIITTYFFYASDADSAVVALLDSTVSVRRAYAYRLGTIDHDVSLLNVGSNFTVLQLMYDMVSSSALNARQGCDKSKSNSTGLGRLTPCIVVDRPSLCAATPAVYRALDINSDRTLIEHSPGTPPSSTDVKVWVIAGVLGGWVIIGCAVLAVFIALRRCETRQRYRVDGDDLSAGSPVGSSEGASERTGDDADAVERQCEQNVEMAKLFHVQLQNNARVHEWLRGVDPPAIPDQLCGAFQQAHRCDDDTPAGCEVSDDSVDATEGVDDDEDERGHATAQEDFPSAVVTVGGRYPASSLGGSRVFQCSDSNSHDRSGL